jgi:FAD/FMN-containing dehydrogenase
MPNISMPIALIDNSRARKTKAEIAARAAWEKSLSTDEHMRMPRSVKANKEAAEHWKRLLKILGSVGMNEAFYENVLGRYCLLLAEHDQLAEERTKRQAAVDELYARKDEMEAKDFFELLQSLAAMVDATDRKIVKKRDQLLAIEKENLLTVQGKLRAIPKKPEEKKPSGIEAFRQARGGGVSV